METISVLGIDLAKNVLALHGRDRNGKTVLEKELRRGQVLRFMTNLPPCLVGMEACGGSHYWARMFREMGHEVRQISPQYVKPYVKTNKNDRADAEAIAEAVTRPGMRFVPTKTQEQQGVLALHRMRERWVKNRTALTNELRGFLLEEGITIPQGSASLRAALPKILGEERLTPRLAQIVRDGMEEWRELEERISGYDRQVRRMAQENEICRRMMTVPGVGPNTATALSAAVGNPHEFRNGRGLAAWLGLVPKQHSSGGKSRLGGISKRGDVRLRELLIHGARSVVSQVHRKSDRRSQWIVELMARRGIHKACVAVANRNARILWAIMTSEKSYIVA
jgi:transposase